MFGRAHKEPDYLNWGFLTEQLKLTDINYSEVELLYNIYFSEYFVITVRSFTVNMFM